ncbi:SIMPL domain-containing protein [Tropicimonas sp. TH_r6]|uniref:SIMPL domain-containing protein n=1 Tax=Tropicimonas sp. TH_r6 TaxID=3082085 RepID=UPI002953200F|nr:SIMPL domain-containing protein [Tropicimonas sp. TH_r6]MDV7142798.1 SIMPL domain-containing protein [Tropicimonas sp. TH_r6]
MKSMLWIPLALALAGAASIAVAQQAAGQPGQLVVIGEGRVAVPPDMAVITLGAVAESPRADEAMQQMSARMEAILARLDAAGIAARDVQTSGLSLQPRWPDYDPKRQEEREIVGFSASSEVTARVRDLEGLGELLDGLISGGANEFRGLQFDLQAPEVQLDAARRAAVADALRKAELYAEAAGLTLGPILSITEAGAAQPPMMRAEMAARVSGSGMPIAAGEVERQATVTVTWALAPATDGNR